MKKDDSFIKEAIGIAQRNNSVYAALVVKDDKVISQGTNRTEENVDPTAHAEIVAIRDAAKKLGSRYLEGCVLYTTCEPCPMCTSAAIWAKMDKIVFGATIDDLIKRQGKRQTEISAKEIAKNGNPQIAIKEGCLREECLKLLEAKL
jgi:tRNA(Arg) A34 adenosine deaminase TadA